MSSPTTSLVRVDASKVKEIAQKVQTRIASERNQKRAEYIATVIKQENDKWFRWKPCFRAEAADIVDNKQNVWGFFEYPWSRVREDEFDLADHFLAAVDLALDNELWLNLKDAETVQKWIVEGKEKNL